jgi:hypothetical protein
VSGLPSIEPAELLIVALLLAVFAVGTFVGEGLAREADALAEEMGVTRGQIYSMALEEFHRQAREREAPEAPRRGVCRRARR